ncbi:hydrogenase maturation protease [Abyssalbus ytuae]|uniref:Hydrogenase maturation protease n=1 Tax=Abyssalbus ytuae TaxID=2926907 RepID=A0A9E6ZK28_9FLAO|nr:hydrogenase maturation protease [Abyssalbus ytuae]UOB17102.1 hydrogenase maturation protease [Abyssalbus ytuae]
MRKEDNNKILVIGIGNIGRQDDALGWLFLDYVKSLNFIDIDAEYRYQLQIEDAELLCNYNKVIFVDAVKSTVEKGFYCKKCIPLNKHAFTSHQLSPETIMYLANNLYHHRPGAFIIGIQGYSWNLKYGLSNNAKNNLEQAKEFFTKLLPVTVANKNIC